MRAADDSFEARELGGCDTGRIDDWLGTVKGSRLSVACATCVAIRVVEVEMLIYLVCEDELSLLLARLVDNAVPLTGQSDENALVVVEVGVDAMLEIGRAGDLGTLLAFDERHSLRLVRFELISYSVSICVFLFSM